MPSTARITVFPSMTNWLIRLRRRGRGPGISARPVVAALDDQAQLVAVLLDAQAIAVVFGLVEPGFAVHCEFGLITNLPLLYRSTENRPRHMNAL
jgi:hypothetical protein